MNKKHALTPEQFQQQLQSKRDSGLTDWWLKQNGLNPDAIADVCIEVLNAQRVAHTVLYRHKDLLTPKQLQLLKNFNHRLNDKKQRRKLRPSSAYPVLNLCTKINRQAHRIELETRQKIQALRKH
jgi:hypothetical protein